MINKITNFTFNHSEQVDDLYQVITTEEMKSKFDSRAEELKTKVNETIDQVNSNTTAIEENYNSLDTRIKNVNNSIGNVVLGQIPNDTLTEAKMAPDMKKDVEGGVASYDNVKSELAQMAKDYTKQVPYAVATGSANAYVVTLNPAPVSLIEGMAICVKINVANTAASTLNVNGLGAKAIKKSNGNDVSSGNLKLGGIYTLRYDGVSFMLQGEGGDEFAPLVAGESSIFEALTERFVNANGSHFYQKVKEIKVLYNGVIRVSFNLWQEYSDGPHVYGRIYKNGVAIGTERISYMVNRPGITFTEDIPVSENDLVQLYLKNSNTSYGSAACSNFKIKIDVSKIGAVVIN